MERLKQLRQEKGLYQKDVAAYLGVDRTTYVKYETGVSEPTQETLKALADYFDVSIDYLLGRTDEKNPGQKGPEFDVNSIEYALYGEVRELDDEEKQQLLELARFMRKRRKEMMEK